MESWKVELFSIEIFLSGTKLFIDPPEVPVNSEVQSIIKLIFILERIAGALFSILFFLAVSESIVRQ